METVYKDKLIKNYRYPKNYFVLENYTHRAKILNSNCGDEIEIFLKIKDEKIEEIAFQGMGCAICIGSASILTEEIKGKSIKELKKYNEKYILKIIGLNSDSPRARCATIVIKCLRESLK